MGKIRKSLSELKHIRAYDMCWLIQFKSLTCKDFHMPPEKHMGQLSIYLRSIDDNGEISVNLLSRKSTVALNKDITISYLELCGVVFFPKLVKTRLKIL
ncbi:hypothetical protein NPIL_641381 [Nephila pilipes]|uniref:Uncharacterized protein n=1 Tax=Nephila pilipes TaxID=299642 RepID=A0A8X6T5G9_NEPPI|nr:hypothetical protein NPIL_641381 [Nephila pilipes]